MVFKQYNDSTFTIINKRAPKKLIIDLRNNSGGHESFSNFLVSYIANTPFVWASSLRLKTSEILKQQTRIKNDTTEAYFKEILRRNTNEVYASPIKPYLPQEKAKRY